MSADPVVDVCAIGHINDGTLRVCCSAHGRVLCAGHYARSHFVETDHSPTCVERIEMAMRDVTEESIGAFLEKRFPALSSQEAPKA